jgi:hypothetical protein
MIKSSHIIKLSEHLIEPSNREVLKHTVEILTNWLWGERNPDDYKASEFLFIKRNVPDSIYTGKAFRVLWISPEVFIKQGIISSGDDILGLTTKQIRQILSNEKRRLSSMTSWSKDLDGIAASVSELEIRKERDIKILISDYVTGVDVEAVYYYLEDELGREPFRDSEVNEWAQSQREVIAPFNSNTFQVEKITQVR